MFRLLRVIEGRIFDELPVLKIEETLRRAYNDMLIDDIELLRDYCANGSDLRHGNAAARELEKIQVLPENATLAEFLSHTRTIFSKLRWREHWNELERLSRNWSDLLPGNFSKSSYLRWLRELLGAPTLERDDLGLHPYARVHLLAYGNAQDQPWSHLIFAGLNDEAWPALNDELAFIRDEQIDELNRQNKTLNRRASKRGRQGEGHCSLRDGKTLLLGPNEQRQIRLRQLFDLVESVSTGIAASASLYSEALPSRIANPSEFFSWLYFNTHGRGVSQQTLHSLEQQTRDWLKDWSPVDAQKVDSISVGRTGYAFDARRQLRPAGEYEFALRSPLDQEKSLRVTQWEQALRWPAIVWMEIFLGEPSLIPLSEKETLRVRGRIDLILARAKSDQSQIGYKDLWVVDYKTGRQRGFSLKELRKKDTPQRKFRKQLIDGRGVQLALYALAVHALGAEHVQLTLLSPAEQLEPQFHLDDVLVQKDFWSELHRMQETGVFGMLGPVHTDFGFARSYPLATLPIDIDLLKEKWALTHPAFVLEEEEKVK